MSEELEILTEAEDLEAVPEALRGFYSQNEDGKFVLEDISALKSSLANVRKERDAAKKAAAEAKRKVDKTPQFSEEELEEINRLRAEAEEREHEAARKAGEYDKLLKKKEEQYHKDLAEREAERERLQAALDKEMVDTKFIQALVAAKATSEGLDLLPGFYRGRLKNVFEDGKYRAVVLGEDNMPEVNADGSDRTFQQFVEEEVRNRYAALFEGTGTTGGGAAKPAGGGALPVKPSKPLSEMTPFEKSAFIAEHGEEAFFKEAGLNPSQSVTARQRAATKEDMQ